MGKDATRYLLGKHQELTWCVPFSHRENTATLITPVRGDLRALLHFFCLLGCWIIYKHSCSTSHAVLKTLYFLSYVEFYISLIHTRKETVNTDTCVLSLSWVTKCASEYHVPPRDPNIPSGLPTTLCHPWIHDTTAHRRRKSSFYWFLKKIWAEINEAKSGSPVGCSQQASSLWP